MLHPFVTQSKEQGVITLPSGLRYKVIKKGDGKSHPTVDSPCLCHYAGSLIDGTEFDSSYSRGSPTTFAPNQVIKGWTEAMQLMVEGTSKQFIFCVLYQFQYCYLTHFELINSLPKYR